MMNLLKSVFGMSLLLCSFNASASVMLHAFNWTYAEISERAEEISTLGYEKVLVSPPYKSSGPQWWARYQPQDYRVIDSPLGNKKDFVTMIAKLRSLGVEVYADLVLNHMANEAWKRSDLNYPDQGIMNAYQTESTFFEENRLFGDLDNRLFSASDFHEARCITDYSDVWMVQHFRLCGGNGDPGLPDLNASDWVINQQRNYVKALKNLGIVGFRIDAAKHMTFDQLEKIFTPEIRKDVLLFGELITNGGRGNVEYDRFLKPYLDRTSHSAYDFPLFSTIRSAFNFSGSFSSLWNPEYNEQALDPSRSISFAVTHDIVLNDGFRYLIMNDVDEKLAYGYLIASGKTTPLVYSDHGESGESRWINAHQDEQLAKMISFHNDMKDSGSEVYSAGGCFIFVKRGDRGFAGINKCGDDITVDVNGLGGMKAVSYLELMSNKVIDGRRGFTIPGRSVALWKSRH